MAVIDKEFVTKSDLKNWNIKINEDYEYLIGLGDLKIVNNRLVDYASEELYIDFNKKLPKKEYVWIKYGTRKIPGVVLCYTTNGNYVISAKQHPLSWKMKESDLVENGGIMLRRGVPKASMVVIATESELSIRDERMSGSR